jgi:cyanophycinase
MSNSHGTLALVGSGEYLEAMQPVDRLLLDRLNGAARVVCLPTAAGTEGAERIEYWSERGVQHFTSLGASARALEVVDRPSAEDETYASQIKEANFVYLSGGRPTYLYHTLVNTPVWSAILNVLERDGVVAGCSAGAMIFGKRATPFPWHRGFDFVHGAIILPHFDEIPPRMKRLLKTLFIPRGTLLGIEGNTALVKTDSEYRVVGSGGVTVWNRLQHKRYTDGDGVTWIDGAAKAHAQ